MGRKKKQKTAREMSHFLGRAVKDLRKRPTLGERCAMALMDGNIDYEFQSKFLINGFMGVADFYLPEFNAYLEIDGGYHWDPDQALKDKARDKALLDCMGRYTLRITNKAVLEMNSKQFLEWILAKKSKLELSRINDKPGRAGDSITDCLSTRN